MRRAISGSELIGSFSHAAYDSIGLNRRRAAAMAIESSAAARRRSSKWHRTRERLASAYGTRFRRRATIPLLPPPCIAGPRDGWILRRRRRPSLQLAGAAN